MLKGELCSEVLRNCAWEWTYKSVVPLGFIFFALRGPLPRRRAWLFLLMESAGIGNTAEETNQPQC
jgi:hypothetical protein